MINELPLEPYYDEEQSMFFVLINNLDDRRSDLQDPFDIVAQLEHEIGCPLAIH